MKAFRGSTNYIGQLVSFEKIIRSASEDDFQVSRVRIPDRRGCRSYYSSHLAGM